MASNDKLWFELGVRDEVTKELDRIIGKTNDLRRAFATALKDPLIAPGIKEGYNNVEKLERAIERIGGALRSIRASKLEITDPKELANLNKMQLELGKMRSRIAKFMEDLKTQPAVLKTDGVADAFLSSIGFGTAITQTTNKTREYTQSQRDAMRATREQAQAMQGLSDAYNKVSISAKSTNNVIEQMKIQLASTVSLYAWEHFAKSLIQVGGEFEQQHIALQAILGDIQQANSMFEQMKELAVVSPFNFRQLAAYSKQVAAFGVPYEEMYDTTKRLADMSAGLGVDMGRLILAYGQVRSAAVLRGQELRQFTEAGIPMVQALAKEFTKLNGRAVSTAEVFELISKRAVPFEMVKKVMWDMTSEGGRFFDMQFVLSDTLLGKWSNLQDAWEIMLSDLAKGESIGGMALKSLVSWTTSLIESMNTLSPVIATVVSSIGLIKAAKWINGKRQLGYIGIDKDVQSAQKLRAIELARLKINGEITRQKYSQLMAENSQKGNYYQALAFEGKLNALQIQRAYRQGYINKQQLYYLTQLKIITAEERKQILLNKLNESLWGRATFAAKGFFRSINASLGPIGWIMIAIDAITTGLLAWWSRSQQIAQKNKDLSDGFVNHGKELKDAFDSMTKTPTSEDEYKSAIEGMKDLLKQHTGNYEAILLEASGVKDLKEQYELLKKEINSLKDTYAKAEDAAPDFADETRSQFENVKEWARKLSKNKGAGRFAFSFDWSEFQFRRNEDIFIDRVKELADKIKASIPNVGMDKAANALYRQLRDALEQEIGYGSREKVLVNIKLNEILRIEDDNALADIVAERFSSAVDAAEPRIANKIRYGKELDDAERDKVTQLVNDAIRETEKRYPEFANRLQQLLNDSNFSALITLNMSLTGTANELQKFIYGNFSNLTDERIKNMATNWATSGSMYAARNNAKKDIDEAYNEKISRQKTLDKLKKDKQAEKSQIDAAQKLVDESNVKYNDLITSAKEGLGYDYEGEKKKSNKDPKGSKNDKELESAKTQLEEVKKFYSEYKKYRNVYGAEKGQSLVEEIFGMKPGSGDKIINDYKGTIRKILDSIPANTEARKKFKLGGNQLLGEINLDDAKQKINYALKELQEHISRQTSQWNLYKQLFEKTGSKEFAQNAFRDTKVFDEYTRSLERELKQKTGSTVIDYTMTQAAAERFFEDNKEAYELWKKIVELTSNNYTNALTKGADAMAAQLTIAEKIRNEEKEIARLRKEGAGIPGNEALIRMHQENIDKYAYEQFKQDSSYIQFFSSVMTMANDEMELTAQTIKDKLIEALVNGAITARQYIKEVRDVNEQLEKGRKLFKGNNFMTFMKGGQKAMVEMRQEEWSNAVMQYELAIKQRKELEKQQDKWDELSQKERQHMEDMLKRAREGEKEAREELVQKAEALKISVNQYLTLGKLSTALSMTTSVLKGFQQAFSSLSNMFDAIGNKDLANDMSDAAEGIGGVMSILTPVNNIVGSLMKGDISGAVGGIISAPIDIFTGPVAAFSKLFDKQNQRMIEESQERVKENQRFLDQLEKRLERTLGGIFNTNASKDILQNIKDSVRERFMANGGFLQTGYILSYIRKNNNELSSAIKEAEKSSSYYDAVYASLLSQKEELEYQLYMEKEKKNPDESVISDFKQQLFDLEDQIKYFAEDMAKALYDIDLRSWASDLTDAIVEAWENGEDAAEAYKNKVKSLMKDLTKNILTKKVLEDAFSAAGIDKMITDLMSSTKGKLDESAVTKIADALAQVGETSTSVITGILNELEKNGYIDKGDTNSSSTSGGIKSITENTADLIASYLNAIRGDVSVNRVTLYNIMVAVQSQQRLPVIAEAQLQQMQTLVTLARERNMIVGEVRDMIHRVETGQTRISVK